ncbi:MAG: hypothetical protein KA754_06725 [Corallincola sp.]|nr:hypothetical protein [Corallincola sp.]
MAHAAALCSSSVPAASTRLARLDIYGGGEAAVTPSEAAPAPCRLDPTALSRGALAFNGFILPEALSLSRSAIDSTISDDAGNMAQLLSWAASEKLATQAEIRHFLAAPAATPQQVSAAQAICSTIQSRLRAQLDATLALVREQMSTSPVLAAHADAPLDPEFCYSLSIVNENCSLGLRMEAWPGVCKLDVPVLHLPQPLLTAWFVYLQFMSVMGDKEFVHSFAEQYHCELVWLFDGREKGALPAEGIALLTDSTLSDDDVRERLTSDYPAFCDAVADIGYDVDDNLEVIRSVASLQQFEHSDAWRQAHAVKMEHSLAWLEANLPALEPELASRPEAVLLNALVEHLLLHRADLDPRCHRGLMAGGDASESYTEYLGQTSIIGLGLNGEDDLAQYLHDSSMNGGEQPSVALALTRHTLPALRAMAVAELHFTVLSAALPVAMP